MISPCPFGILELRANLNTHNELNFKNKELKLDS